MLEIGDKVGIIFSSNKDSVCVSYGIFQGVGVPDDFLARYSPDFIKRRVVAMPRILLEDDQVFWGNTGPAIVGLAGLEKYTRGRQIIIIKPIDSYEIY